MKKTEMSVGPEQNYNPKGDQYGLRHVTFTGPTVDTEPNRAPGVCLYFIVLVYVINVRVKILSPELPN